MYWLTLYILFFFFNDTATTEIYTLSLHDALPIYDTGSTPASSFPAGLPTQRSALCEFAMRSRHRADQRTRPHRKFAKSRSEEHTSELQSRLHLVCRLLLEKKKTSVRRRPSGDAPS